MRTELTHFSDQKMGVPRPQRGCVGPGGHSVVQDLLLATKKTGPGKPDSLPRDKGTQESSPCLCRRVKPTPGNPSQSGGGVGNEHEGHSLLDLLLPQAPQGAPTGRWTLTLASWTQPPAKGKHQLHRRPDTRSISSQRPRPARHRSRTSETVTQYASSPTGMPPRSSLQK